MKHIAIFILFIGLFATHKAHAQFFNFRFGSPFMEERQQQPVTQPQYKGGNKGLNDFLLKNYKNPVGRHDVEGQIVILCLIDTKGKVSDLRITRSLDRDYDMEAVRVVKKLKFKPATQGKKKVNSRYEIYFPIRSGRLSFTTLKTVDV